MKRFILLVCAICAVSAIAGSAAAGPSVSKLERNSSSSCFNTYLLRNFFAHPLIVAIAFLIFTFTAANAVAKIKPIPPSESKILLEMPYLTGGVKTYSYNGWTQTYSLETWIARENARSAPFPRALVYLFRLAPGHVWRKSLPLDEVSIQKISGFLKKKKIRVLSAPDGADDQATRTMRFSVDEADCIGFSVVDGTIGAFGSEGARAVLGYYCGAIGKILSSDDVKAVLSGWKLVD